MIKITQQKLEKILNAAGLTKSKYHKSQQVKGYGESTVGYRITKDGLKFDDMINIIDWDNWKISFNGSHNNEWNLEQVRRIEQALKDAGIPFTKPTWFFVPRYYNGEDNNATP